MTVVRIEPAGWQFCEDKKTYERDNVHDALGFVFDERTHHDLKIGARIPHYAWIGGREPHIKCLSQTGPYSVNTMHLGYLELANLQRQLQDLGVQWDSSTSTMQE